MGEDSLGPYLKQEFGGVYIAEEVEQDRTIEGTAVEAPERDRVTGIVGDAEDLGHADFLCLLLRRVEDEMRLGWRLTRDEAVALAEGVEGGA